MDRRKLRRLLASSSFAAIVVAAQSARAQAPDLTNPAGVTVGFLLVDTGDVVGNVINEGVLDPPAGKAGIIVEANGVVTDSVHNVGTIRVDHTGELGTGILVTEAGAVGDGVFNEGQISVDITGSEFGQARGIAIDQGVVIGGTTDEGGIANDPDARMTVLLDVRSVVEEGAGGSATASNSGTAIGIDVGPTASVSGGVYNYGSIVVDASIFASANATGGATATANGIAQGKAVGVQLLTQNLNGGFHNNTRDDGKALIDVDLNVTAKGVATATGAAAANATATGSATGVKMNNSVIAGGDEGGIFSDGIVDVDAVVAAQATAVGAGNVNARVSAAQVYARGIAVDAAVLTGGYEVEPTSSILVNATLNARADASAKRTAGFISAHANISNAAAKATGVRVDVTSIFGNVENAGLIEVHANAVVSAEVDADSENGDVSAHAAAVLGGTTGDFRAIGLTLSADRLSGSFENRATVEAHSLATINALADGAALAAGKTAGVAATVGSATASAVGLQLAVGDLEGDLDNLGVLDVDAQIKAKASAAATAGGFVGAQAHLDVKATALGLGASGTSLAGRFLNEGDVAAQALVTATVAATAKVVGNVTASAIVTADIGAQANATGLRVEFSTIAEGFQNDGFLDVRATMDLQVGGRADSSKAGGGLGHAGVLVQATSLTAQARGIELDSSSLNEGIDNEGQIVAQAKVDLDANATAKGHATAGHTEAALAQLTLSKISASANGFDIFVGTLEGFHNGGTLTIDALVTITAVVDALVDTSANGGSGPAGGRLEILDVKAQGRGIELDADTVFGDIVNDAAISVEAGIDISADLSATGPDGAFADLLVDPTATARGLGAFGSSLSGAFRNSASIAADAVVSITGEANALATAGSGSAGLSALLVGRASATGLIAEYDIIGGGFANSGPVEANAIVDLNASGNALNSASGSAFAKVSGKGHAFADGVLIFSATSIDGGVANEGTIDVLAKVDITVDADAEGEVTGAGGGNVAAYAIAQIASATAEASGLVVQVAMNSGPLTGGFRNSGDVNATALVTLVAAASAKANGANQTATASVLVSGNSAFALGVFLGAGSVSGDVVNEGNVTAAALIEAKVLAHASATNGTGNALVTMPSLTLNVSASGLALDVDTLTGNFDNSGDVQAVAQARLRELVPAPTPNGTTGSLPVVLKAVAGSTATVNADVFITATARGVNLDVSTLNGDLRNSGWVRAQAVAEAILDVTASAVSGNANAALTLGLTAKATGLHAAGSDLNGDVVNEGRITALAVGELGGGGTAGITANVKAGSEAGNASATLSITNVQVSAWGLLLEYDIVRGNVTNNAEVRARASGEVDYQISATGENAHANAGNQHGHIAQAIAVEVDASDVIGDVTNLGNLVAQATMNARYHAIGNGENGATASAHIVTPGIAFTASAIGYGVFVDFLDQNVGNSGKVTAEALGNATVTAEAHGSVSPGNADASITDYNVTAVAVAVSGLSLGGSLTNSGNLVAAAGGDFRVHATADSTVTANANAYGSGAHLSAVGITAEVDFVSGDLDNSGDIFARAEGFVTIAASAKGDGKVTALASFGGTSTIEVRATGIYASIDFLGGSVLNQGQVTAMVTLQAGEGEGGVAALAIDGEGGGVNATADAFKVTGLAIGLAVTGTSRVVGGIVNEGKLAAQAIMRLSASAEAQSTGDADASASLSFAQVLAFGIDADIPTIGGDIRNTGLLSAKAQGAIDIRAVAGGTATGVAGHGEGSAVLVDIDAIAVGAEFGGAVLEGNVLNDGTVVADADLVFAASVSATGESAFADLRFAKAKGVNSNSAIAVGYFVGADTLAGGFTNNGKILADALLVLGTELAPIKVTASGDGAPLSVVAEAIASTAIRAFAEGVEFNGPSVIGAFANEGFIQASAALRANIVAAARSNGNADVTATINFAELEASAIGILYDNMVLAGGGAANRGTVRASATMDLALRAETSKVGGGRADVHLTDFAAAAAGMLIDGDGFINEFNGGFVNESGGIIVAEARLVATGSAIASAKSNSPVARAELAGTAYAAGMEADDVENLNGGFANAGTILVKAHAEVRVQADAAAPGADLETATATASASALGMIFDQSAAGVATLGGGMLNQGLIMVTASAFVLARAGEVGLPDGAANAKASAFAAGMLVAASSVSGDVRNDGTIIANAKVSGSRFGTAGALNATASAIGMFALVSGVHEGGLINSGSILVHAEANLPAVAVGMGVGGAGLQTGALDNEAGGVIVVTASDANKALAAGLRVEGSVDVEGGIENGGAVIAVAIGTGASVTARAIDVELHTGSGLNIRMVDGTLEAFTKATENATATNVGTAVAMQGNAEADSLDWSGGRIEANIIGDQGQDFMRVLAGVDSFHDFDDTIDGLAFIDIYSDDGVQNTLRLDGLVQNVSGLNVLSSAQLIVGRNASINVNTYTESPDATLLFEIEPGSGNNGVITVNNNAALDGTIGIRPLAGLYFDSQTYLVIDGNLSGTFDNTEVNTPLLSLGVEQSSPDVVLTVTRNAFTSVPGLTHNQNELGEALDDFYDPVGLAGTDIGEVVGELFTLNTDELLDAYDELHGAEYAQMAYAAFESMEFVLGGVNQRLHDARSRSSGAGQSASLGNQSLQYAAINAGEGVQGTQMAAIGNDPDHPGSVWGKGYGSWGKLDGDDEAPGYDRTTGAIVVGLDYRFDQEFLVGIVGAYSFSNLDFDDGDNGDIDSFQIGLFGSWDSGTWYVDGLVSYAFQSYDTERHIDFGSISEKADADYDGGAVQVYGEVGYQFEMGEKGLVTPLLGLGYTSVWTSDFTEKGASGANLRVDDASYDSLATTLGVRGSLNLDGWEPSLFLGWRHEFLDDHGEADVAFAAVPDSKWQAIGSDVGSDAGLIGVGVVAEISAQFEAVIDYGGQFSGSGSNHTGSVGLRLKF